MNWLLVPTGVSQLLTQIAAMRLSGHLPKRVYVRSACYHWNTAMNHAIQEACDAFGLVFLGNTDPVDYSALTAPSLGKWAEALARFAPRQFHKHTIAKRGWSLPNKIHGLVVCIRPRVFDELFYHSAIRPGHLICTIDGVNPQSPNRQLRGELWRGFNAPFVDLPTEMEVFSPEYLMADAAQLGKARSIPRNVEGAIFATYRTTPLASEFADLFHSRVHSEDAVAVVFSQQLSQSLYCSPEQEIAYYLGAIETLRSQGFGAIIFKQHPRDPRWKLSALSNATADDPRVLLVPEHLACIPIEPFLQQLSCPKLVGASTNSSTLLSFRALTNASIVSFDSPLFQDEFRKNRSDFCTSHNIPSHLVQGIKRRAA